MLHLVFRSPFNHSGLADCLARCAKDDCVVLLEDAVLAALEDQAWSQRLMDAGVPVWVMQDDLAARGVSEQRHPGIALAGWDTLVALSAQHRLSQSWL